MAGSSPPPTAQAAVVPHRSGTSRETTSVGRRRPAAPRRSGPGVIARTPTRPAVGDDRAAARCALSRRLDSAGRRHRSRPPGRDPRSPEIVPPPGGRRVQSGAAIATTRSRPVGGEAGSVGDQLAGLGLDRLEAWRWPAGRRPGGRRTLAVRSPADRPAATLEIRAPVLASRLSRGRTAEARLVVLGPTAGCVRRVRPCWTAAPGAPPGFRRAEVKRGLASAPVGGLATTPLCVAFCGSRPPFRQPREGVSLRWRSGDVGGRPLRPAPSGMVPEHPKEMTPWPPSPTSP